MDLPPVPGRKGSAGAAKVGLAGMSAKPAGGQGHQPATKQPTTGESYDAITLTVAVGEVTTLDHEVGNDACSGRGPQGRCQLWATAWAAHQVAVHQAPQGPTCPRM